MSGVAGFANDCSALISTASRPRMDATGMIPCSRMASAARSVNHASAHGFASVSPAVVNVCTGSPKTWPPPRVSKSQPFAAKASAIK